MLHLDAVPWFAPADSTSRLALVVEVGRFHDPKIDWNLNRLLLTAILPAGDDGIFWLRLPYLTFDTGEIPVAHRWPWIMGPSGQDGWPGEKRIDAFGQIEVGATGPLGLPLIGGSAYALALGLPTGTDRAYPYSSVSLPFRIELRKPFPLGRSQQLGLTAGYLMHMDSGRDYLTPEAFSSGYHLGASWDLFLGRGRSLGLNYDYQDRDSLRSQLAQIQMWFPWGEVGSWGFKVAAELQGTLHRPAEWYFTLGWRFDSPRYRLNVAE
jgi:hypothetical protein